MNEGLVRLHSEAGLYFLELHSLHTVGAPSGNVLRSIGDCIFNFTLSAVTFYAIRLFWRKDGLVLISFHGKKDMEFIGVSTSLHSSHESEAFYSSSPFYLLPSCFIFPFTGILIFLFY